MHNIICISQRNKIKILDSSISSQKSRGSYNTVLLERIKIRIEMKFGKDIRKISAIRKYTSVAYMNAC